MRYKGVFNHHGEITTLHRHANSEAQALSFMHQQLAHKYDTSVAKIRGYFDGKVDNFKIGKT